MKSKKVLQISLLIGTLVLILAVWAGFFLFQPEPEQKSLLIGGSTTMYPYTQALIEAYRSEHPDTSIYCSPGGAVPGLLALQHQSIDLAMMSRDLTEQEDTQELENSLVARDAIGFVVHPNNPIDQLKTEQLAAMLRGDLVEWGDVSSQTGRIHLVLRQPESQVQSALEELVLKGAELAGSTTEVDSPQAVLDTVLTDPLAIGLVTLQEVDDRVKLLAINGVPLARETVLSGRYPLTRSFYLVALESQIQSGNPVVQDFLHFAISEAGQQILSSNGATAVR